MENKNLIIGYDPAQGRDVSVCVSIEQLIKDVRMEERKHCADLYSARLVKLSARVLKNKMVHSDSAALLQSESENIDRQAQEWNYV
ncbi:DUF2732 family protein [Xenorhabdus bovienii]|uniref:Uncharacterized protein n=2 Tax=Xenorhabdus bovienii TaxID=40576 RepID=A0A077QJ03_XENBV|nr:DUF2732 family protein [Xenorhabdus bovienii]CBJ80130.1 hypothetical protein XBJ1_0989 [Xenorhabdus bovienii SS-2004]CDH29843.1 hypothetical protein XBJ2_440060 [Xenorhabdus bovienii str. Jollieti]CDH32361.1 hypothetical protein XBI1_1930030 [Xenorhabdus bovienii str. Intermedium]